MKQTLPWLEAVSYRPAWGPLGLLAVLVAGTAICVEPAYTAIVRYQRHQAQRVLLAEQQALQPLYMQVQLKSIADRWSVLPMPAKRPLTLSETREIGQRLTRLMEEEGLTVKHLQPEIRVSDGNGRFLHVGLTTKGSFARFTDVCRSVLTMPFFAGVDRLVIRTEADDQITAEWSLWLMVE